jgi:hypothetical protein
MGSTLSVQRSYSLVGAAGFSTCLAPEYGLIIVFDCGNNQLHMLSLADGSWVRSIRSSGSGIKQVNFDNGGLCESPDGDSMLVPDADKHWYDGTGGIDAAFTLPATALAALPDGKIVVRGETQLFMIRDHGPRLSWIGCCVSATRLCCGDVYRSLL